MQRLLVTGGAGTSAASSSGGRPAAGLERARDVVRAAARGGATGCRPTCATRRRERGDARRRRRHPHGLPAGRDSLGDERGRLGGRRIARRAGQRLVHLSTDVVFDGTRGRYREEDEPAPVNDYGRSKAEAERRVAARASGRVDRAHVAALRRRRARAAGAAGARGHALLRRRDPLAGARRRPRGGAARPGRARPRRPAAPGRRRRRLALRLRRAARGGPAPGSRACRRRPTARRTSRSTARGPRALLPTRLRGVHEVLVAVALGRGVEPSGVRRKCSSGTCSSAALHSASDSSPSLELASTCSRRPCASDERRPDQQLGVDRHGRGSDEHAGRHDGNAYQVASSPTASSSAPATRPPCDDPRATLVALVEREVRLVAGQPLAAGHGRCSPVGLSPHPQHAGRDAGDQASHSLQTFSNVPNRSSCT